MKPLAIVLVAILISVSGACGGSSTAPSPPLGDLKFIGVSMSGSNGQFNDDGAMLVGHTFQMTATARFANSGQDVTKTASWDSSNHAVGTISADGALSGLAVGTTVVTATYEGQSGSLTVTVSDKP